MYCSNCNHEFKAASFAYKARQRCPECGTLMQIQFPSGMGFIPITVAILPAVYMVSVLQFDLLVGLSVFILVYWPIEVIMNILLIYFDKYRLYEVDQ